MPWFNEPTNLCICCSHWPPKPTNLSKETTSIDMPHTSHVLYPRYFTLVLTIVTQPHCRLNDRKNRWQETKGKELWISDVLEENTTARMRVRKRTGTAAAILGQTSGAAERQTGKTGMCSQGSVSFVGRKRSTLDSIWGDKKFPSFYSVSTSLRSCLRRHWQFHSRLRLRTAYEFWEIRCRIIFI